MATVKVLDIADSCYSWEDGKAVYDEIKDYLVARHDVRLSFSGVSVVTSTFVNAALIDLLDSVDFETIREHLTIADVNSYVADMIVRRFRFEVENRTT